MGSNLARKTVRFSNDSPPVLKKADDGLIAPSTVHSCEEDSHMTGRSSKGKEASMSKLVADDDGRLEIKEINIDGEVLEASKKLDPVLCKGFLLAIEMHARIVRALLFDKDRADPRATPKRLGPLQPLLESFRRQVIQGIDKRLIPLMLAELNIVNHILIQVLPADTEKINEVDESFLHQIAISPKILNWDTAVKTHHDKHESIGDCESNEGPVKAALTSGDHEQVNCLNLGVSVESESGIDCAMTTNFCINHGGQSAGNEIDSEESFEMIDAADAVSEVSTNESEDTEFSFEMIDIPEPNEIQV